MFERIADRWKREASGALLLVSLAAACAATAAVTLAFLCAAAFIAALNRYGLVDACLVGAAVFLAATLVLLAVYAMSVASRRASRASPEPQPAGPPVDPRLVLIGLQLVQAVGIRRLLPILAVGGAALAFAAAASGRRRGGGSDATAG